MRDTFKCVLKNWDTHCQRDFKNTLLTLGIQRLGNLTHDQILVKPYILSLRILCNYLYFVLVNLKSAASFAFKKAVAKRVLSFFRM